MFLYSQSNQKYKYKECMVAQTQKTYLQWLLTRLNGESI